MYTHCIYIHKVRISENLKVRGKVKTTRRLVFVENELPACNLTRVYRV